MPAIRTSLLISQFALAVSLNASEPIVLEAEDGMLSGISISTAAAGFSGTGYVTGFDLGTDKVQWDFEAGQGFYELIIGFRTPNGEKGFAGYLNGVGLTGHFPASSSFSEYRVGRIYLSEGVNQLEIGGGWSWYEIDYARFTQVDAPAPPTPVNTPLVNPNATPKTVHLMNYLKEEYGKHTLSGQFQLSEAAIIENVTSQKPAMLNGDLIEYSPTRIANGANPNGYTESIIAAGKEGYILSLTWHWNAPADLIDSPENPWWSGFYTRATTFDIAQVLAEPQSEKYQLLISDMDAIAVELKKLQAAGLPVLWRPLHEPEGAWFWWGARGAEPFRQLWQLMFERYTNHHGLNNLIWVLASEHPDWYPGDDVVDIVGVDAYPDDRSDPLVGRWEPLLQRFDGKKLLALTEFGGVPDIPAMQFLGVWWSFFASWTGDLGPGSMAENDLRRIYTAPEVLTFEELPDEMYTLNWAGYPIGPNGLVNTGDLLGWINVDWDPFIYSAKLDGWIYLSENWISSSGSWIYVFR